MRSSAVHRIALWTLMGTLVLATSAIAQPPAVTIPPSGQLLAGQRAQLEARMTYFLDQMEQAEEAGEVIAAREQLLADYERSDAGAYRYDYAQLLAEQALNYLDRMDSPIKQVNLGLAVSQMDQVSVQPALEAMVRHENPALRYLGWQGYRNVRLKMLSQPGEYAPTLYDTLSERLEAESTGEVAGVMFRVMILPPVTPPGMSEQALTDARQRFMELLQEAWPTVLDRVRQGEAAYVSAARSVVLVLNSYSLDASRRDALLKMAAGLAQATAEVYQQAQAERLTAAAGSLLLDVETLLNNVLGSQERFVKAALDRAGGQAEAIAEAVEQWMQRLRSEGVELDSPESDEASDE